ncbi:MAG: hypothetical protein SOS98_03620 [Varibaculum sp.]|nr:hypothetical protein [Varibaculum sp.]
MRAVLGAALAGFRRSAGRSLLVAALIAAVATLLTYPILADSVSTLKYDDPKLQATVEYPLQGTMSQDVGEYRIHRDFMDDESFTRLTTEQLASIVSPNETVTVENLQILVSGTGFYYEMHAEQGDLRDAPGVLGLLRGRVPGKGEISLSVAAARKTGANIGDSLDLKYHDQSVSVTVVGVSRGTDNWLGSETLEMDAADAEKYQSHRWYVIGDEPVTWEQVVEISSHGSAVNSRHVEENPPSLAEMQAIGEVQKGENIDLGDKLWIFVPYLLFYQFLVMLPMVIVAYLIIAVIFAPLLQLGSRNAGERMAGRTGVRNLAIIGYCVLVAAIGWLLAAAVTLVLMAVLQGGYTLGLAQTWQGVFALAQIALLLIAGPMIWMLIKGQRAAVSAPAPINLTAITANRRRGHPIISLLLLLAGLAILVPTMNTEYQGFEALAIMFLAPPALLLMIAGAIGLITVIYALFSRGRDTSLIRAAAERALLKDTPIIPLARFLVPGTAVATCCIIMWSVGIFGAGPGDPDAPNRATAIISDQDDYDTQLDPADFNGEREKQITKLSETLQGKYGSAAVLDEYSINITTDEYWTDYRLLLPYRLFAQNSTANCWEKDKGKFKAADCSGDDGIYGDLTVVPVSDFDALARVLQLDETAAETASETWNAGGIISYTGELKDEVHSADTILEYSQTYRDDQGENAYILRSAELQIAQVETTQHTATAPHFDTVAYMSFDAFEALGGEGYLTTRTLVFERPLSPIALIGIRSMDAQNDLLEIETAQGISPEMLGIPAVLLVLFLTVFVLIRVVLRRTYPAGDTLLLGGVTALLGAGLPLLSSLLCLPYLARTAGVARHLHYILLVLTAVLLPIVLTAGVVMLGAWLGGRVAARGSDGVKRAG